MKNSRLMLRVLILFFSFLMVAVLVEPATAKVGQARYDCQSPLWQDTDKHCPSNFIHDNQTGLFWMGTANQTPMNWAEAIDFCIRLSIATSRGDLVYGWRLPSVSQLDGLLNCQEGASTCLPDTFTLFAPYGYWSGTVAAPGEGPSVQAWAVNLSNHAITLLPKVFSGNEPIPKPAALCVLQNGQ